MIVQVRYAVTGATAADMEQAAREALADFVEDASMYRTAIEVHECNDHDGKWLGHVTARPKRKRSDDDDDFGW